MDDATAARPTWHFWGVGLLSLVWNGLGAFDYVMTKSHNAGYLAAFNAEQRAWFDSYPPWMEAAWAVGIWCGVLGSLLLLLRSRWALPAFVLSLAGLAVATLYQYGVGTMPESLRTRGGMAFTAALWIVAALLVRYALLTRRRGVLR
jgi:hypothetical protein